MFFSNLQYPKSFQREKKNCAIMISTYQNTFLESSIRLLAFLPTFSAIVEEIDLQKIKSPTFKGLLKIIKLMNKGQYRILKIDDFENQFFNEFPEFLSYQNHESMKVLFSFFKLIETELGWKDCHCFSKQILETSRTEWDFSKNSYKYSPVKQILLCNSSMVQICSKCKSQENNLISRKYFQCLSLEPEQEVNGIPFLKRKNCELNLLKKIENSFSLHQSSYDSNFYCQKCLQNTEHKTKTLIQPGNYMLFHLEQDIKTHIPKQLDLNHLDSEKFIFKQNNLLYEFVAGIYKHPQDKGLYAQQYGAAVYHFQNKKYISFEERKIHESETLNFEKSFSLLVYKRKPNEQTLPIIKNIKSTLYLIDEKQLEVSHPIPLPDFFFVYLMEHHKVPPLMNHFICHHGMRNLGIQQMTKSSRIKFLPIQIYNFLVDQFGGRKVIQNSKQNFVEQCKVCQKGIQNLNQIKKIEKQAIKYADNFSIKKGQVLIYKPWVENWKTYLYEKSKQNYTLWGNPPPLQINNYLGMKEKNLKNIDYSKYTKISSQVWTTLVAFHSGGPQLNLKKMVRNNAIKNYIDLRLKQKKRYYDQFIRCLPATVYQLLQKSLERGFLLSTQRFEEQCEMMNSSGQSQGIQNDNRPSLSPMSSPRGKSSSGLVKRSHSRSLS